MRRRPDVFQVNRLVLLIVTDRLVRQVDIDRTGDCVGNDERRRSQVVGFHLRVNAAFKVPVTGQYGGYRHIVVGDRFADFVRKRTGVPDASRAAVTGNVEAERFERLDQARFGQVLGDNQGARRQAAFDVARFTQTKATAFFATRPAPIITLGFDVLVQDVIAAMTTAPVPILLTSPFG